MTSSSFLPFPSFPDRRHSRAKYFLKNAHKSYNLKSAVKTMLRVTYNLGNMSFRSGLVINCVFQRTKYLANKKPPFRIHRTFSESHKDYSYTKRQRPTSSQNKSVPGWELFSHKRSIHQHQGFVLIRSFNWTICFARCQRSSRKLV